LSNEPATTPLVRIAGVGSHHGPDAAGWLAVQRLQETGFAARFPAGTLALAVCDTPAQLPALAAGAGLLVVIDALASDAAPGTLYCLSVADLARDPPPASSHALGPAQLLELIAALEGDRLHAVLFGIGVGNAPGAMDPRSAPDLVDGILEPLAAALGDYIQRFLAAGPRELR